MIPPQETTAAAPCARIYRLLHGSPMLAGVPAHIVLALLATGCLGGFGLMMVSTVVGISAVGLVGVAWALLALVYRQDRVAVPLFLLRLRCRFPAVTSSFTRSYPRILIEEDTE